MLCPARVHAHIPALDPAPARKLERDDDRDLEPDLEPDHDHERDLAVGPDLEPIWGRL